MRGERVYRHTQTLTLAHCTDTTHIHSTSPTQTHIITLLFKARPHTQNSRETGRNQTAAETWPLGFQCPFPRDPERWSQGNPAQRKGLDTREEDPKPSRRNGTVSITSNPLYSPGNLLFCCPGAADWGEEKDTSDRRGGNLNLSSIKLMIV